jgi:hypothetical protein
MTNVRHIALALALGGILTCGPAGAAQRVFVSSTGSDANTGNNCAFTTPCRGFAAAMTVVDAGGEVVALDAAGYGVVTITKSVSIVANPGFYAGIAAGAGTGITIATAGVSVLLRGLNINSTGGSIGISMTAGNSLTIDNCVIANFTASGVVVNTPTARVKISGSVFSGNGQDGLLIGQGKADVVGSRANGNVRGGFSVVATGAGNVATLTVTDSTASGNAQGFFAQSNAAGASVNLSATRVAGTSNTVDGMRVELITGAATGVVGNSTFTENINGLNNAGGTLRSMGNNVVDFNTNNTTGTITSLTGL